VYSSIRTCPELTHCVIFDITGGYEGDIPLRNVLLTQTATYDISEG
jgi:hypothetical protein